MANIVVAIYNPLARIQGRYPYFDAFLNGLKKAGNNVLCFEKTNLETHLNTVIPEEYLNKIKDFNPDLFIFANNQFWDISKYFEQPIIIYDVDSPNGFCNTETLKHNGRYKYVTIQQSNIQLIKDILQCPDLEVTYIPPFSEVKSDTSIHQDINIAFCGSHWVWNDFTQIRNFVRQNLSQEERKAAKEVYREFLKYPFISAEKLYEKLKLNVNKKISFDDLFYFTTRISGVKRLRYLLAVQDLGLEIRGGYWVWDNTPLIAFPELLLSYSNVVVNELSTTQNFYNQAKIGFNTNHIQAQTGFSWRVTDILASNACLVTEKKADLDVFGFEVPQYESESEARMLCQRLLRNDNMRQDIVSNAHEIVDKKHRFIHILPIIEEVSGISLRSEKNGTLEIILTDKVINGKSNNLGKKYIFPVIEKGRLEGKSKFYYKVAKHFFKKIKW